jgi:hypothetical protein
MAARERDRVDCVVDLASPPRLSRWAARCPHEVELCMGSLPVRFELDGGEVCWGDWAPDVSVIYATDDEHARSLVVTREYAERTRCLDQQRR